DEGPSPRFAGWSLVIVSGHGRFASAAHTAGELVPTVALAIWRGLSRFAQSRVGRAAMVGAGARVAAAGVWRGDPRGAGDCSRRWRAVRARIGRHSAPRFARWRRIV